MIIFYKGCCEDWPRATARDFSLPLYWFSRQRKSAPHHIVVSELPQHQVVEWLFLVSFWCLAPVCCYCISLVWRAWQQLYKAMMEMDLFCGESLCSCFLNMSLNVLNWSPSGTDLPWKMAYARPTHTTSVCPVKKNWHTAYLFARRLTTKFSLQPLLSITNSCGSFPFLCPFGHIVNPLSKVSLCGVILLVFEV